MNFQISIFKEAFLIQVVLNVFNFQKNSPTSFISGLISFLNPILTRNIVFSDAISFQVRIFKEAFLMQNAFWLFLYFQKRSRSCFYSVLINFLNPVSTGNIGFSDPYQFSSKHFYV